MTALTDNDTLEAALAYLRRGWSVVPIEASGKRPLVRWEGFQHRAASEETIRGWFQRWPKANVGIVTGTVSGLAVVDIDPRHGGDDSLAELERQHGALPETSESQTGGGGRHLYFRHPGPALRNRTAIVPGVDLRCDGGMVVAPPSLHPSGRHYVWEVSHHPDDVAPAAMPAWLLELCRGTSPHGGHSMPYWRSLVHEGIGQGARNSSIASLTGHLLFHGVDPEVALELLLAWNRLRCRPPLDDEEVARTVESVTRTHFRHRSDDEREG